MKRISPLVIRDAQIIFKNFSGKKKQYNPQGNREFSVVLEDPLATQLHNDGWNVKPLNKRDPDEPQRYHLPVRVNFDIRPPRVICISGSSNVGVEFGPDQIAALDWSRIIKADVVIRPRVYDVNGSTGIKAYLQSMGVIIEVDEVMDEYGRYLQTDTAAGDTDLPF